MKVLVVTQYFWPEDFRINDLVLGLRDRGHHVTVLTGKPNYPGGRFFPGYGFFRRPRDDFHGVPVVRVPLVARGGGGAFMLVLNYASFALLASLLAPVRCRGSFDAILVYEPSPVTVGLPALVLKRVKRAPLLFWVQDLWPESLSATGAIRAPWILNTVAALVGFIYRGCDRILVQSRAFIEPVRAFGVPAARIAYFPNSAEDFYRPVAVEPDAPERARLPQGFRIMFAGNVGAAQDFETIVSAAELLKSHSDIQWIIIGDGRMLPWLAAEIKRRELQSTIIPLGRQPVESMPRWFALADAMLVTLKRDPIFALTIPAKVQSYLACGRPIIGSVDGEAARVIEESGAGIAVASGDPRALADAVIRLHRTPTDEREAMGRRGRLYFERHFERDLLLRRLETWMREVITTRSGADASPVE
jgi:glycosyltransferase involved in cell wall biosynthesis